MKVNGIAWLGVRTEKLDEMSELFEDVFGAELVAERDGFRAYDLQNGDTLELFSNEYATHKHFTTGPVAGFLVNDIFEARKEMEARGIEFIEDIAGDPQTSQWAHFRGPDGNVYELKWNAE